MALRAKTRRGKISRRKKEFAVVRHHIERRPQAFYAYLLRKVKQVGNCFVWTGSKRRTGYGRVSLRMNGERYTIDAHRLFLILALGHPIPVGYDAGHRPECKHRNCVLHVFKQRFDENAVTDPDGAHFGDF